MPHMNLKRFFGFIGVLVTPIFSVLSADIKCPNCDGKMNKFYTDFSQKDCTEPDTYITENVVCDCFPACQEKTGFGDPANQCIGESSKTHTCAPGLQCTEEYFGLCVLDKESCFHYKYITPDHDFQHTPLWSPSCNPDGTYKALQCKGEQPTGRCFCTDPKGNRLFGQQWWRNAENMTCACSLKRAELEADGRKDVSLHCDSQGNYEPLQCDSGLCWCADPKTGDVTDIVVPEGLMEKLLCYDEQLIGDKYLRQCESQSIAQAKIQEELFKHGTLNAAMVIVNCDADGSYGAYQFDGSIVYCSWKDKSRIKSWQVEVGLASRGINCYCARDTQFFQVEGVPFTLTCSPTGNYSPLQAVSDQFFCVDSDGYDISGLQGKEEIIECTDWVYQEVVEPTDDPFSQ